MTREEAVNTLGNFKRYISGGGVTDLKANEAINMAIEALKREQPDEWCTDCKEYDTEKKCCPRFNRVIREALKREPSEDGTLEVKVEDATKIGRVLISDDEHRGGLYYPDEDEPKGDLISRTEAYIRIAELSRDLLNDDCINLGNACDYLRTIRELPSADRPKDGDLISRAEAIEALGEEPLVWCDEDYEIAERSQWRDDVEAIKSVPSADRPRGEWNDIGGVIRWGCSLCHYAYDQKFNFCPNCGAKMDGERSEE